MTEQPLRYEWGYTNREELTTEEFLGQLKEVFSQNDVVSVGGHHDLREDSSFGWVREHDYEILHAYDFYRWMAKREDSQPFITFLKLLPPNSKLWERMTREFPSIDQLRTAHVGRLFAFQVLPIARSAGFTHLVLEGLDHQDPARTIQRSKDQIGNLLQISLAMMMGMKIYGAYAEGLLSTPVDIGNALFDRIKEIKDREPNAKVIAYNGASHNMTEPFKKGTQIGVGILSFDASELTYAPRARQLWGNRYGAIDLISGHRKLEGLGHFTHMQIEASDSKITAFSHGVGQKSFVIK